MFLMTKIKLKLIIFKICQKMALEQSIKIFEETVFLQLLGTVGERRLSGRATNTLYLLNILI